MIRLGWDIGGVNTKVARLDDERELTVRSRPFELQQDPGGLVRVLRELAADVGVAATDAFDCVVTMTAELSQMFRTKRTGVHFVLDAVETAFPAAAVCVFAVDGELVEPRDAREHPLRVAAANWAATARLVARRYATALLVDVGTTTTDIIPVVDGEVVATGTTDPERLASGELVYSGVLRTPVEAIVSEVPYRDGRAAVSAEGFALIGDVHLWRGHLAAADYTVRAPDGRQATRDFAGERIVRVICADRELLDETAIDRIADAVAARQVATIAGAITRVATRHPAIRHAVVTGLGEFVAAGAARAAGLSVLSLAEEIGGEAARFAPAAAVALLSRTDPSVDLVVKVGGGLLAHVEHLDRVLRAIADAARACRVLIVPGGGPFADTVRDVDARLRVGDDAAHRMAVLAMDQYAHVLTSRIPGGMVVAKRSQIGDACDRGHIPVIAPSQWLSAADPLPHTWDVTSDSIAAWIAGELKAPRLLLVKPPGAQGGSLVDPCFGRTLPAGVAHDCLASEDALVVLEQIAETLAEPT